MQRVAGVVMQEEVAHRFQDHGRRFGHSTVRPHRRIEPSGLSSHPARDVLEAGDADQQLFALCGMPVDHVRLRRVELMSGLELLQHRPGYGDAADVTQHCRDGQTPVVLQLELFGDGGNHDPNPGGSPRRGRAGHREHIREHTYGAAQRALQQVALGVDQFELTQRTVQRPHQGLRLTRLGQEPEQIGPIDDVDRGVEVSLSGQHHHHRVRGQYPGSAEELGSVHQGHHHVADDHRERIALGQRRLDGGQPLGAGTGRGELVSPPEGAPQSVEQPRLVIDEQHTLSHPTIRLFLDDFPH